MGSCKSPHIVLLLYVLLCSVYRCFAIGVDANQTANLLIDASQASARPISDTLFGIFFEEINHAGAGGVWAELVSNRGYFQTLRTPANKISEIIANAGKRFLHKLSSNIRSLSLCC